MNPLIFFSLVILCSLPLSKAEINAEGKYGYGEKFPVTWRAKSKWVRLLFTGTSYHLYMGLFLLAFLHSVLFILGWSLRSELLLLSFLAFLTVAEDFLWFVLNPAIDEETGERLYGIQHFSKKYVPWFYWFGGLPLWYWWYLPIGGALYVGASYL